MTYDSTPNRPITASPLVKIQSMTTTSKARNQVLKMGSEMGSLCHQVITFAPLDQTHHHQTSGNDNDEKKGKENDVAVEREEDRTHSFWSIESEGRKKIRDSICSVFRALSALCDICGIDLSVAIVKKMELNAKKYPVELCKGKSGKYTTYSSQTGITKNNQSTLEDFSTSSQKSISELILAIRQFAMDRQWAKYHTPRNITLAMMGELGELGELFQWHGDSKINKNCTNTDCNDTINGLKSDDWSDIEVDKVQQEIADVAIYCLRLADVVGLEGIEIADSNFTQR